MQQSQQSLKGTYAYKINGDGHGVVARGALHLGDSLVAGDALAELARAGPGGEGQPLGEDARELLEGSEALAGPQLAAAEYRAVRF